MSDRVIPEAPSCDDKILWDIYLSRLQLPALMTADEIGLFRSLDEAPSTRSELAAHCGISERAMEPLLGMLCALGLIEQDAGVFRNSEVARTYLLPQSPYYWGAVLDICRGYVFRERYVADAIRNKKQFDYRGEGDLWKANALEPEQAAAFTAQMHSWSFASAVALSQRGDFEGVGSLLDVAGGSGCFSIALAKQYPDMRCTVLELPSVCPVTEGYIADFGLSGRIDTVGLDVFGDLWPAGYDAVFFSHVFHDWDARSCRLLAEKAFNLLPSGGRVYLHETLLNETRDGPLGAAALSMNMLVWTEGKQYTAEELKDLLASAGFRGIRQIETYGYHSLISATKP